MHTPGVTLGRLRREARAMGPKEAVKEVVAAFQANDLLTYANAIAFQVFFALVPLLLALCGLLGFFGLTEVYTRDVVPSLDESTDFAAFEVIDNTIRNVLGRQQVFWVSIGLLLAIWKMSGAVRAVMGVFDRIYCSERERSTKETFLTSFWLAVLAGVLFLLATAVFVAGPAVWGGFTVLRWLLTPLLLFAVMATFLRFAPADHQPLEWVSFGSALVVVAWLGTSLAFGFYVRDIASYGSIFGALATVIITFEYLYLAAVAFLTGAQLDGLIRERSQEG